MNHPPPLKPLKIHKISFGTGTEKVLLPISRHVLQTLLNCNIRTAALKLSFFFFFSSYNSMHNCQRQKDVRLFRYFGCIIYPLSSSPPSAACVEYKLKDSPPIKWYHRNRKSRPWNMNTFFSLEGIILKTLKK